MARAHWREKHERMRTREVPADTARSRALADARGQVLREGITYRATGVTPWQIRRSLRGRVNQIDVVVNGVVWRTGAMRFAERAIRRGRWPRTRSVPAQA